MENRYVAEVTNIFKFSDNLELGKFKLKRLAWQYLKFELPDGEVLHGGFPTIAPTRFLFPHPFLRL
jgi:hypothetical protein